MAERRMLAKSVIFQDALNDLHPSYFKLYVFLDMTADDDGIVDNPRMVACMAGCQKEQLQELIDLGYLLRHEDGLIVITHWHVMNSIRKDRYKASIHTSLRKLLHVTEDSIYTIGGPGTPLDLWLTSGTPRVSQAETQDKISKDKINKDKKSKNKLNKDKTDKDNTQVCETHSSVTESSSESSYTDFEKSVLNLYTSCCPSLPKYQYLSEELRESIAQLEKSYFHTETIKQAFMMAEESDYLKGKGKDGWQADLSWLCKDGNLQKVLEGRYRTYRKEPAHNSFYGCNGPGQAELEAIQKLLRDDDPNYQIPALRS